MHNHRMGRLNFGVLWACVPLVWAGLAGAAQAVGTDGAPLRVLYQERPPYSAQQPDGTVAGLLAAPVQQALARAGIVARWELTPSQRQLLLVQSGQEPVCALGWFRNPEREKLGRFSRPLYRDLPMGGLVRADVALADGQSLQSLLASPLLTFLTKEGFSYGAEIDRWLTQLPGRRVSTGSEPLQLTRMLLAGRADLLLVAPEEGQLLIASAPPGQLRMVRFTDVGPGLDRHLYCNFSVTPELLRRIDRELERPTPPR
jgi:polar amino acid transport system substrate-binding protein